MTKDITKRKFCISVDIDVYEKLIEDCKKDDAKLSTRINTILKRYLKNEKRN